MLTPPDFRSYISSRMRFWFRSRSSVNGFTLVELIVVVLLLGFLGTIAIPKMFGTSREAKLASTMRDCTVIADAAAQYRAATSRLMGGGGAVN